MTTTDRLTLTAAEAGCLTAPVDADHTAVPHVGKHVLRASMQLAMEALTDTKTPYSLESLADRQEILDQKRRENLLAALEAEDDFLSDDPAIDAELIAGAHLDELHDVLEYYNSGALQMSQDTVDDMVALMTELRRIMPNLPEHMVSEIKAVARPLRKAVNDFQESIEVI